MKPFEAKFTPTQRSAIFLARFDTGLKYAEISRRARLGELIDGQPFEITAEYIGKICREEANRRAGRFSSPLAGKPHRDAVEELRRGVIGVADDLVSDLRAQSKRKPSSVDPKRLQEAIRAVTLAAALPARDEPAPTKMPRTEAGHGRRNGPGNDDEKRLTRTGALMRAMRETGASEAR